MSNPYRIQSLESLRAIIGEQPPGLELKVSDHLDRFAVDFIQRAPFLVLSTASDDGRQDASPKGDAPGFVLVEDSRTLVIPDRPGNRLIYGLQNILSNPHVGILFIVPGTPETLRVNGTAEVENNPQLLSRLAARGKPALLAIRVHVQESFFHCGKAFIRSQLWKPHTWPERLRISFGEMLADKLGADPKEIDAYVEEDYRQNL